VLKCIVHVEYVVDVDKRELGRRFDERIVVLVGRRPLEGVDYVSSCGCGHTRRRWRSRQWRFGRGVEWLDWWWSGYSGSGCGRICRSVCVYGEIEIELVVRLLVNVLVYVCLFVGLVHIVRKGYQLKWLEIN
jgi:hypothetical protein